MNIKHLTLYLFLLCSFQGFSQNKASFEHTSNDTLVILTRCECLQINYERKRELLDNLKSDENGRIFIQPALVEKHGYTFLDLKALSKKCDQSIQNEGDESCPEEAKLTELDAEFELTLRVIDMNGIPHGDY